jgi:hypothetical protein
LLAVLVLAATGRACNVPVFRFALESPKWTPDSLELMVFYRGSLSDADQERLTSLRRMTRRAEGFLNLEVDVLDVSAGPVSEDALPMWSAIARRPWPRPWRERVPLPWAVVGHARGDDGSLAAWDGPLTAEGIGRIVDSPLRREIARRILAGDSVVWVLLESGDAAADEAAHTLLTSRLAALEKEITLPKLDEDDRRHIRSRLPLRLSFPVLRLSRSNPEEAVLIRLLLSLPKQPELARIRGPIVYPFFGRGRVADALSGEDLSAEGIEAMARYLAGPCSCEVKEDNPGADLPFNVDWAGALERDASAPPRPVSEGGDGSLGRAVLWTALGLLGVVVTGAVVLALRGGRRAA